MEATDQEREVILKAIQKRADNKYKWAYLIFDIVSDKLALNMTYDDIAKWLSDQGLIISQNTLKKSIWEIKKRMKTVDNSKVKSTQKTLAIPEKKSNIASSIKSNTEESTEPDLSEQLRLRELKARDKMAGFDGFEGL